MVDSVWLEAMQGLRNRVQDVGLSILFQWGQGVPWVDVRYSFWNGVLRGEFNPRPAAYT